jgi:cardiolipin synthase
MLDLRLARALAPALLPFVFVGACSGGETTTGDGGAGRDGTADVTRAHPKHPDAASDATKPPKDVSAPITLTLITEPDQGMTPIYDFVRSAKRTIDMTMYELVDPMFTGLLTTAAAHGVAVRVILDQNLEMRSNTSAYDTLSASKAQVHWANPVYAATHQKTITVDGAKSLVMSINLAAEYYATSRDFAVETNDPVDVAAIEATFDSDWTDASVTPSPGDGLVWSPTNSESDLLAFIGGAKKSLLVENEEMSFYTIVSALAAAAKNGVNVEIAMVYSSEYAENFAGLTAAGAKVVTYSSYGKLYIHAKAMVADYGTSDQKAFVGSENFSDASLTRNRELGLITSDTAIVNGLEKTLASDFAGGTPFVPDAGAPPPMDAAADGRGDAPVEASGG